MKQVSYVISTYTSDVSGVCSALYELGGMVVIHDPSGCNSTYNTHDEPRWFDQDSLIFISGLSQMDAVMGDDQKFVEDLLRAAKELNPRFIALVRSPIPLMIGTDFEGIAMEVEARTGIPVFFVPTTGMKSYVKGVDMALQAVVRYLMPDIVEDKKREGTKIRLNLLGVTPLDFSINGMYDSLCKLIQEEGFCLQGSLALNTDYETVMNMSQADVNLVVTASGLGAAKAMKERYGIPYVLGFPCGIVRKAVVNALKETVKDQKDRAITESFLPYEASMEEETGVIVHEPLIAECMAVALEEKYGKRILPVSMVSGKESFPEGRIRWIESEEEMKDVFEKAAFVVADPMFQPICPQQTAFYPLPHEAFSGRIYRKDIPDLLEN